MNNSEQTPGSSSPILEIVCGKTASPLRPILQDRFLIGSGPRCDLRLGGDDMPLLHSIVHISGGTICIDPVADTPQLLVNGRPGAADLQSGDEIVIGRFRMVLHGASVACESQAVSELNADTLETEDQIDPSTLSAAELVELIEAEEALIEEFEARRQSGADALLDAVQRRADALPLDTAAPQTEELLGGIRSAVLSLGQSTRQLEQPAGLSESDVQDAAASLLDCQQEIISALDRVLSLIEQRKADDELESRRHVA